MADFGTDTDDDRLALELASGKNVRAAATAAGVSERTAHRRLAEAGFRERVAVLRTAVTLEAVGKLSAAASDAVDALHQICTAGESAGDRIRAADALLRFHLKYTERADIEGRLRQLERANTAES